MATTPSAGADARKTTPRRRSSSTGDAAKRRPASRSAGTGRTTASTSSTQPVSVVAQAQALAERAVLVPVGAGLLASDNLVSSVRGLAARYSTRAAAERELRRYERRGATARNRFERQVRRTRRRFERELRHQRTTLDRSVSRNRRRLEREVRSVRRDFERQVTAVRRDVERQSGAIGARAQRLVSEAQQRIGSLT